MNSPSLIAVAGDWHGNADFAVASIQHAVELGAEHIIHVGDYGGLFEAPFLDAVERALTDAGVPLWFVRGNHDSTPVLTSLARDSDGLGILTTHVRHIPDGHRWVWGGHRWLGIGGAPSVNRRNLHRDIGWWEDEQLSYGDALRIARDGATDVVVAHDRPSGYVIPGLPPLPPQYADQEPVAQQHRDLLAGIADAVQPDVWLHGHYHLDYRSVRWQTGTAMVGLGADSGGSIAAAMTLVGADGQPG